MGQYVGESTKNAEKFYKPLDDDVEAHSAEVMSDDMITMKVNE